MTTIHLARQFPIALRDIESIASMLRGANALVGARNASADWYDPMWYFQEQELNDMTFTLLVDRNVYSMAAALAKGRGRQYTDQHRTAAAALCFARCCGLRIETSIAILEHELDGGDSRVHVELPRIRAVFSAGPEALANFALGRTEALELPRQPDGSGDTENAILTEEHRPAAWRLNYGCALKIACLLLDSTSTRDVDRFLAYLQWCYDEFFFSAGPTVYGSLALSAQRKRAMFKRLRSTDSSAAMRGIRNAAWDMTLISEWEIRQQEMSTTKNHHLICSFDRALTDVANAVMCQGLDERARSDLVRSRFIWEWGANDGVRLFETYESLARSVDSDGNRPANQEQPLSFWNERIGLLEVAFRQLQQLGVHR